MGLAIPANPSTPVTLPPGWSTKTLRELGEPVIGLTYDQADVSSHGLLVLRASNITTEGILAFDDNVFVDTTVPERLIAREDDLLICVRNGSRQLIGKSALIDKRAAGMTFGAFMSVFRSPHNRYIFHQFQSGLIRQQIREYLGATINQITNASLRSFEVPIPDDSREESAIVTALDAAVALTQELQALITKKSSVHVAAMQSLLTGIVRLPGFSRRWKSQRFGQLFQVLRSANNSRADLTDSGEVGYLHYGDIHAARTPLLDCGTDRLSMIPETRVYGYPHAQDGDLVMVDASEDYAGLGKSVELTNVGDRPVVAGLHTFLLRPDSESVARGFAAYLQFIPDLRNALIRLATGISVFGISKASLRAIELVLPEAEEQSAIASVLSEMTREIAALKARRDKLRLLKEAMMQELLSGKTRLL